MLSRIAIVVGAALGFVACRPGAGDYCLCPDECRGGLVCAQNGVELNACIDAAPGEDPGRCVEQGVQDMGGALDETAAPEYHDVGGKRDFEPGVPTDESTTSAPDDPSTSTSATGGSSSTGGSTSTGGPTSTSGSTSSSTGSSSGSTSL